MVYFVGAGCGAPDLITVRGQRLLSQADVIIHAGSLVNPQLLQEAKEGCQIYNSASMTWCPASVLSVGPPPHFGRNTLCRMCRRR